MTSLVAKLRTASRMSRADRSLVVEAAGALVAARLRSLTPFRTLARHLGDIVPPTSPLPLRTSPLSPDQQRIVRRIRWAVTTIAPWLPFRTLCLQQAIAARTMLAGRGIDSVLHLGVDRSTGTGLKAHAWLDTGGIEVTGYPVDPALVEVARFV